MDVLLVFWCVEGYVDVVVGGVYVWGFGIG